jgi:hypothetical protein
MISKPFLYLLLLHFITPGLATLSNNNFHTKVYSTPIRLRSGLPINVYTEPYSFYSISKLTSEIKRIYTSDVDHLIKTINILYKRKIKGLPIIVSGGSYSLPCILAHEFKNGSKKMEHVFSTGCIIFPDDCPISKDDITITKVSGIEFKLDNILYKIKKDRLSNNAIFLSSEERNSLKKINNNMTQALETIENNNYHFFINQIDTIKSLIWEKKSTNVSHCLDFFFQTNNKIDTIINFRHRLYCENEYQKKKKLLIADLIKIQNIIQNKINYVTNINEIINYKKDESTIKTFNYTELESALSLSLRKINQTKYTNYNGMIKIENTDDINTLEYFPLIEILTNKLIQNMHKENINKNPFL